MEHTQHILIVDDDAMVRDVLNETLRTDYKVTCVASGVEALDVLRREDIGILLADQRMPNMTGVELVPLARTIRPNLVSIILSAYTDPKVMIDAINHGQIFRFIRKPWDVDDLRMTLQHAAERYQLRRDNARLIAEQAQRLRAFEILQHMFVAMLGGETQHPMAVLLGRLREVVSFDVAALLLEGLNGQPTTLEIKGQGSMHETHVTQIRDQAEELFCYFAGRPINDHGLVLRANVQIKNTPEAKPITSQVQVPLKTGDRVVGVLVLQSCTENIFPHDTVLLLDLLANEAAVGVERMREVAANRWGQMGRALDAIPDGVILCDVGGRILVVNQAARRFVQEHAQEPLWTIFGVTEGDLVGVGAPVVLTIGPEKTSVEVSVVAGGALFGGGQSLLAVVRDLSAIKEQESQRRMFVSTFSHEIRTPLTSISASLDILLEGFAGELNDKQRECLQRASSARVGLTRIIDQLLDLERYARGQVEHRPVQTNLADAAKNCVARFEAASGEREISIQVLCDKENEVAFVDPRRITQVFENLVTNAIKFSPRCKRVDFEITTSTQWDPWHVVSLTNESHQITPAELDQIFDRFCRSEKSEHVRGSGLGLAIARSIIDAHGGSIMAQSNDTHTTFWLAIPTAMLTQTQLPPPHGIPIWVLGPRPQDAVVAVSILRQAGLTSRLAPDTDQNWAEARTALGDGIAVRIGATPRNTPIPVLHASTREELDSLGRHLSLLTRHKRREILLSKGHPEDIVSFIKALGFRPVVNENENDGDSLGVRIQGAEPNAWLCALVQQIEGSRSEFAQARLLIRRALASESPMTLGHVQLDHLDAFRGVYGFASAKGLQAALGEQVRAAIHRCESYTVASQQDPTAWVPDGVVLMAPRLICDQVMRNVVASFGSVARLHYRREDRERGYLIVGNDTHAQVPLVCATGKVIEIKNKSEEAILSAIDS